MTYLAKNMPIKNFVCNHKLNRKNFIQTSKGWICVKKIDSYLSTVTVAKLKANMR